MRTLYNQIANQNLERLAALSDGVFAFAMTLLAGAMGWTLALTLYGLMRMCALRGRSTTPTAPSASFPPAGLLPGRRIRSLIHASLVVTPAGCGLPHLEPHLLACSLL